MLAFTLQNTIPYMFIRKEKNRKNLKSADKYKGGVYEKQRDLGGGGGGVFLLSQQVAHTQRVLLGLIWSQSIGAAGHMVLPLKEVSAQREQKWS